MKSEYSSLHEGDQANSWLKPALEIAKETFKKRARKETTKRRKKKKVVKKKKKKKKKKLGGGKSASTGSRRATSWRKNREGNLENQTTREKKGSRGNSPSGHGS